MVAEDGFGELDGGAHFSDAWGSGEDPGGGEAAGGEGALELCEGAGLSEDGEHGGDGK